MSHRRGPWSQQEDDCLMHLVREQGPLNWVRIAQTLGSRTPKQCRERFHQNLKPTLNHEPITPEEGAQIETMVESIGKRWAEIARRLHGRSDNAVKNWWNGNQNRRRRQDRRRAHHGTHGIGFEERSYAAALTLRRPSRGAYTESGRLPVPGHAFSSPSSPTFRPHSFSGYHSDSTLPSPSPIESPRSEALDADPSGLSDSASSYTTSPHHWHKRGLSPLNLPPLRNLTSSTDSLPRSLPGVESLFHAADEGLASTDSRSPLDPAHPALISRTAAGEFPHLSRDVAPRAPSDRDSRMAVRQLVNE